MDISCLNRRERRLLNLLRFKKSAKPRFDVRPLVSLELIQPNYSGEKNEIGEALADGTYSLTDAGRRYFIQRRDEFFTKRLPVAISLAALTKSFWPEIKKICKWLIEALS